MIWSMDGVSLFLVILFIFGLVVVAIALSFFNVWLRAWLAGAYVSIPTLIAMRLRKVPYGLIVDCRITAGEAQR